VNFPHEAPDFADLVTVVAGHRRVAAALVEKDYWVTHALWGLHRLGLEIWFKGGTSLSKGFGLIERFSEDLDLKVEPGTVTELAGVTNWKSDGTKAARERQTYFETFQEVLRIRGMAISPDPAFEDRSHRSAQLRATYPGTYLGGLAGILRPFVLIEIGDARATPFVRRDMTSFIHEELDTLGQLHAFEDNRPRAVRCVHPVVTLIEKLDALHRRVPRGDLPPATFVRHFEDAAHIIAGEADLPALEGYESPRALADEMVARRQVAALPEPGDPAFSPDDSKRFEEIRRAHLAIAPMFWGPRIGIDESCSAIRRWIEERLVL
jgi:Nucleotidyl transferase AbiEii toxin, Type IV TA system